MVIKQFLNNKNLRDGTLFSMFSFINKGLSFLLLLVLAKYITPQEYGFLSLFSTVVMLLGYFIAMTAEGYMPVAYFREGETGVKNTYSSILWLSLFMLFIFVLILFTFQGFISERLSLASNIILFAIIICFLNVHSNLFLDYFRLHNRVTIYGIISITNAFLNFVISILFVKFMLLSWEGRVYAQLFTTSIFAVIGICFFVKHNYITINIKKYIKPLLIWSIPLIPHMATTFIRQGCDRYIINSTHEITDVGLFSFALNLANIISMLGFGFNQSNSVDIYKTLGNENLMNKEKYNKTLKQSNFFICFYILASISVFMACYFVLPIILPKYADSLKYFPVLAIYGFLICIYLVYTNYLFYYKKTKKLMYITFGSSVIHLLLSLWITKYSLYYTAFLYVFTQLGVVFFVKIVALKTLKNELK